MGVLTLVRHGQATFFEDEYDKLSPLGETQARLLGEFWTDECVQFSEVFSGPRVRQLRTAEIVGDVYRHAGLEWGHTQVLAELDEYDSQAIMNGFLPILRESDPLIRELADRYNKSRAGPAGRAANADEAKSFQRVFEAVIRCWIAGRVSPPDVEQWRQFTSRVRSGIDRILTAEGRARKVVVFTSGGPIAATMQYALGLSDTKTIELNWQVRNLSLTEFLFAEHRLTLDRFNALPHLRDRTLWSYR